PVCRAKLGIACVSVATNGSEQTTVANAALNAFIGFLHMSQSPVTRLFSFLHVALEIGDEVFDMRHGFDAERRHVWIGVVIEPLAAVTAFADHGHDRGRGRVLYERVALQRGTGLWPVFL